MSRKTYPTTIFTQILWLCAHTVLILQCKNKTTRILNIKIMDMFLMAVRFLGTVAEIKEKTHKIFG